jgi:hypothetical protein
MTLTPTQIAAIANQFVAIAVKHGGVVHNRETGAIKFPSMAAREAFEAEYAAAERVI